VKPAPGSACLALAALAAFGCSRGNASPLESSAAASATVPARDAPVPAISPVVPRSSLDGLDASSAKPFGAPCVGDAECAGGVCFHKRLKGPDAGKERRGSNDAVEPGGYCSLRCNDDADCPVPPTRGKCGARGMCKRLD
jgi:hypothetical protein